MFNRFESFALHLLLIQILFVLMYSTLNITEMKVPTVVVAPETATLGCVKEEDKENDTFQYLRWHKFIDNKWQLIKKIEAQVVSETSNTTNTTNEERLYKLEGLTQTTDTNIQLNPTSLLSAGFFKCSLKSTSRMDEMIKELRIVYKPKEGILPEISLTKIQDNHITVQCRAPASYPMTGLAFFINYELAAHEDVHQMNAIKTKNSSLYGETEELIINVEELKIKASKENVLNGNIQIVCTATLAQVYHAFALLDIPYDGPLYDSKCLTLPMIILIIVIILVVIVIIVAVVWVILRKKKLNSLNKVSELFNKQKTITVLVDNQKDE